ncbi:MAG: hypothetical protein J6Y06_01025 [Bacteroidales bacterium]|nr:hypothetical protein [Bacteroidales bacterium]
MNPFALAYREQQQLFIFDRTYLLGTLLKVGGLATLIARFIVQFFWNPALACTLTLLLLALSAFMTWSLVKNSWKDWTAIPLCLIPSFLIGVSLSDNSLHYEFLTSILLVQAGLLMFKSTKNRKLLWGSLLTIILYLTSGPAAILFALSAAVIEKSWKSLTYPIVALICVIAAYFTAAVPTWSFAFSPALYYDLDATLPVIHWGSWISLLVVVLCCEISKSLHWKRWIALTSGLVLALLVFIPTRQYLNRIKQEQPHLGYVFEHFTNNEDWDGLIEACKKAPWLPRTANYLNMALAWKGELADQLLKYDQHGPDGLVMTTKDRAVDVVQAHIMFAMGNVAAAQDVAFNTLSSLQGFCPAMLKINAQVELMRGSYEVADKYLSLLAKTPHYRKWAIEHRKFLYDDAAVESDSVLGSGRRNLSAKNRFIMYTNPMTELFPILDANPYDKRSLEYGLCYLLLSKDLNSVKHYIQDYYSSPDSPELPRIAQEAMVFYSEYSRNIDGIEPFGFDWCYEHGVQPETVKRFEEYQKAAVAGPVSLRRFRETYWYYLVHKEI